MVRFFKGGGDYENFEKYTLGVRSMWREEQKNNLIVNCLLYGLECEVAIMTVIFLGFIGIVDKFLLLISLVVVGRQQIYTIQHLRS